MGFPYIDVFSPEKFREDLALAKESGIITRPILSGAQGVGIQSKENPVGSEAQTLKNLKNTIQKTADLCKKELGHTEFYSYGVDEGGPSTIRAERNAWKIAHDAGGKIMVSTFAHRELLFALDYMILPGAP